VIRRKTNRGHMTGDHHGREADRATLLVRAMDEILGTHRLSAGPLPAWRIAEVVGLLAGRDQNDHDREHDSRSRGRARRKRAPNGQQRARTAVTADALHLGDVATVGWLGWQLCWSKPWTGLSSSRGHLR